MCGSPHTYHPYGGFIIGLIAGLVYVGWNVTMKSCNVDDVIDTIAGKILHYLLSPSIAREKFFLVAIN